MNYDEIIENIFEIVENHNVEIENDEILMNYELNELIFYTDIFESSFNDEIENENVLKVIDEIEIELRKIFNDDDHENINIISFNHNEFSIEFENNFIELLDDEIDELYDDMKIYF